MGIVEELSVEDTPRSVQWEIARLMRIAPVVSESVKLGLDEDQCVLITFDIRTDTLLTDAETEIQDVEPIAFQYLQLDEIGTKAPHVLSMRANFPRSLSHINPTPADFPVSLCLARAGVQSLYNAEAIEGVVLRLLGWLNAAKVGSLNEAGWEPVPFPRSLLKPETSALGYINCAALQSHAAAHPEGGIAFISAPISRQSGGAIFVHAETGILDTENAEDIAMSKAEMANEHSEERGTVTSIPAIFIWPKRTQIDSDPHFTRWTDMQSFTDGLKDVHLHEKLDEAFIRLEPLFGDGHDVDRRGNRAVVVIVGLWRPAPLDATIVGLATDEGARCLELRAYYLERGINNRNLWSPATVLRSFHCFIPAAPDIFSAVSGEHPLSSAALLGAGALGSAFADYAIRGGCTSLGVFDKDKLYPHNLARHRGTKARLMQPKVEGVARHAFDISQDLNIGGAEFDLVDVEVETLVPALERFRVVLDLTANPWIRRKLAALDTPQLPVMRAEIFNQGKLGVAILSTIGADQNLNCLFHQLIALSASDESVRSWLSYEASRTFADEELLLGFGCGSATTKMPAYKVDSHASALYAVARHQLEGLGSPLIALHEMDEQGLSRGVRLVKPAPVKAFGRDGHTTNWKVLVSEPVLAKMHELRQSSAPNETGGYLFGAIDESLSEIYVVAVSSEPPGTNASPMGIELGPWGKTGFEKMFLRRTQGRLPPVGTWHSHPNSGPAASNRDKETVESFRKEDHHRGIPTVMAITGRNEDKVYVFEA